MTGLNINHVAVICCFGGFNKALAKLSMNLTFI